MKKAILSIDAPKPAPFFSQAVLTSCKYRVELSGQIGLNPESFELVEGGVGAQTERAFKNIEAVLAELGWTLENVVKTNVYLVSMDGYKEMNDVYATKFGDVPPARAAVAVKELPLGASVEIECVAAGDEISAEAKEKYGL